MSRGALLFLICNLNCEDRIVCVLFQKLLISLAKICLIGLNWILSCKNFKNNVIIKPDTTSFRCPHYSNYYIFVFHFCNYLIIYFENIIRNKIIQYWTGEKDDHKKCQKINEREGGMAENTSTSLQPQKKLKKINSKMKKL